MSRAPPTFSGRGHWIITDFRRSAGKPVFGVDLTLLQQVMVMLVCIPGGIGIATLVAKGETRAPETAA